MVVFINSSCISTDRGTFGLTCSIRSPWSLYLLVQSRETRVMTPVLLILSHCTLFQPMDQASLKNSDVLILTGLTQIPTANPDGMVGEFCSNLGRSLEEIFCVFYHLIHCFGWEIILRFLELNKLSSYSSWHKTSCLDFTMCSWCH